MKNGKILGKESLVNFNKQMSENYKSVDLSNWNRTSAFEFYKEYEDPSFNISGNIKITKLLEHCKKSKESFFLHSLYKSLKVVNAIPEFRFRLKNDELVEFEKIHVGSTFLKEDNSFGFCYFDFEENVQDFIVNGKKSIDLLKSSVKLEPRKGVLDLVYHSVIPWVSFTSIKHARKGGGIDTIPKIAFGKYFRQNNDWMMPVSVEGNHAMMDGFHVGQYFKQLEELTA